jgi:hypothetical protein
LWNVILVFFLMLTLNLKFRAQSIFLHKYQFYQGSFQVYLYLLRYFFNTQVVLFFKSSKFRYTRSKLTLNKSPFVQTKVKTSFLEVYSSQKFVLSALIPKYINFFTNLNLKSFIYLSGLEKLDNLLNIKVLYKFEKALFLPKTSTQNSTYVQVFS